MQEGIFIYKKEVDWSLFFYGFAIPVEQQKILTALTGRTMPRGETREIHLYLNGRSYGAKLKNLNVKGTPTDRLQVRYEKNSEIAVALRGIFHRSCFYIQEEKRLQEGGSKKQIPLPEEYKEYLVMYTTQDEDSFLLEAILSEDVAQFRITVQGKEERFLEAEMSLTDEGAGYQMKAGILKIRRLNRLIGENLKMLYGYRCQICGKAIGEEYGAHIAEAHHIEYFVKSLNNDASNQMIVCPNHHSIIHETDPVFDREHMAYVFPGGKVEKLKLNKHL